MVAINHVLADWVAGVCTVIACVLSLWQIRQHYYLNRALRMRNYCIRILLMIPIFAVEAYMALLFKRWAVIYTVFRECYEAFVVFSFVQYMLAFLGGTDEASKLLRPREQQNHIGPMRCILSSWCMGPQFLYRSVAGVLQYTVIMPLVTLTSLITWCFGVYGDGDFKPGVAYPWLALIVNFSQMYAIYCLVLLYHALEKDLHAIKPLNKLLTIKGIVFVTFWQSVFISGLTYKGVIHGDPISGAPDSSANSKVWTTEDVAHGLQNFIICVEMVFFAVLHQKVFHFDELNALVDSLNAVPPRMTRSPRNPTMTPAPEGQVEKKERRLRKREFFTESINFFDIRREIAILIRLRQESHMQVSKHGSRTGNGEITLRESLSESLIGSA